MEGDGVVRNVERACLQADGLARINQLEGVKEDLSGHGFGEPLSELVGWLVGSTPEGWRVTGGVSVGKLFYDLIGFWTRSHRASTRCARVLTNTHQWYGCLRCSVSSPRGYWHPSFEHLMILMAFLEALRRSGWTWVTSSKMSNTSLALFFAFQPLRMQQTASARDRYRLDRHCTYGKGPFVAAFLRVEAVATALAFSRC
jgi:hypothetical protein